MTSLMTTLYDVSSKTGLYFVPEIIITNEKKKQKNVADVAKKKIRIGKNVFVRSESEERRGNWGEKREERGAWVEKR